MTDSVVCQHCGGINPIHTDTCPDKPKAASVFLFANGNSAVCDSEGQQMPELQQPWLLVFVKHLEAHGVNAADIVFNLPGGRSVKLFRTSENTWNWTTP